MTNIFGGRHSMTEMGDLSEAESDTSSIMGETSSTDASGLKPPSPATREQLAKRMESLIQENRVLMVELETYKLRVKTLQEENRALKQASVLIQAKAEQEEEFISNTLLKKIQELKKEKEALALNYEQEEECLTNDLSRKLNQLRQEKAELASTLQQEQESMVGKLLRKIKKLEADTLAKQQHLEQLRREKVELENTLEQEQEALVNRLWKRMDKLESEKQYLQQKLDQPISAPPSPMDTSLSQNSTSTSPAPVTHSNSTGTPLPHLQARPPLVISNAEQSTHLARDITRLRNEVGRLKHQLRSSQHDHTEKMAQFVREEQQIREENLRLQRRLQLEVDRRMQLCRHLSESESSLEMDEERLFNELSAAAVASGNNAASSATNVSLTGRSRTISSPISCVINRPVSPALSSALNVSVTSPAVLAYGNCPSPLAHHRCPSCGTSLPHCNQIQALLAAPSPPPSVMFSGGSSTVF
uniref:Coiled-coil domain-containing protein 6 n=1 Tax=Romanomermis culicivorax TaxID=13658 RepID=A0A915HVU1_ROMCU